MGPDVIDHAAVRVYRGIEDLSRAAAELFVESAQRAASESDRFVVALSGGHSPQRTYELLAQPPLRTEVPWDKTHIFWGDERCVPRDNPRNNATMAFQALLDHVPIPRNQIHPVPTENSPKEAADWYENDLRAFFKDQPPCFDLVLLGLGEDGHTASIFPHTPVLDVLDRWAESVFLPDQNQYRVTLTLPILNQAKRTVFLVHGADKARVLRQVLAEPRGAPLLPAQLIRPGNGELLWLVDEAAVVRRP